LKRIVDNNLPTDIPQEKDSNIISIVGIDCSRFFAVNEFANLYSWL